MPFRIVRIAKPLLANQNHFATKPSPIMLKNYFKVAFRNLVNNKVYSVINIGGLTLGIATALLILLWVNDELSYDRYHTNADRLFRTVVLGQVADQEVAYTTTPAPFAELISGEIPEIRGTARVNLTAQALFTKEFLLLVLLAFALAVPVSYYLMYTWLQGFVYRTSIGLTVFALAITFAVLITLLTVSYQSLRAALANPVDSLRSE
ncbi:MAG: ABC transporter permease [Tunicatimonas sp.]